jgi:hypothetical protein
MYADDMVLLSNSMYGLQKALHVLEVYCKKWHLVVNIKKTKVIPVLFNTRSNDVFQYGNKTLETVHEYKYLGVLFHKSGTFTAAMKDLANRAAKAYYKIRSVFKEERLNPRLTIKLFDTMVKPITLYCSEAWGGFGIKQNKAENLLTFLYSKDCTPFEKLNLKLCKQVLGVHGNTSNIGSRAELGRMPMIKSVIVAMMKYYARLSNIEPDSVVFHAYKSQESMKSNSGGTLTFVQTSNMIMKQLSVPNLPGFPQNRTPKDIINCFGKEVTDKCMAFYSQAVGRQLEIGKTEPDFKLKIYAYIKNNYEYESYLDSNHRHRSELTKFRLSSHWLPIERGRYNRPKIVRAQRICTLCKSAIGDEMHAMFRCSFSTLTAARERFMQTASDLCPQFHILNEGDKLLYLLKGSDRDILHHLLQWLADCNATYKRAQSNPDSIKPK